MNKLMIVFCLLTLKLSAQVQLKYDKRFVECEDKWVAFKMDKDSNRMYGFIYIDEQAGLTLNSEGTFKINSDNSISVKKFETANLKIRLQPNNVLVALIPASMYKTLEIEANPSWLQFYKTDTASAKRLYKWGFMYNGWNECEKALGYLLRAKNAETNYPGLNVEIAYSYNCLEQYNEAEKVLEAELKIHPKDAYVNKEYIYAATKINHIDAATAQYINSLKVINEDTYNAENCYNILQYYYKQKDKANFDKWYKEMNKCSKIAKQIKENATQMKADL